MLKSVICSLMVVGMTIGAAQVHAQTPPTVSLTLHDSMINEISVDPSVDNTFQIAIRLDIPYSILTIETDLVASDAGIFDVTGGSYDSAWSNNVSLSAYQLPGMTYQLAGMSSPAVEPTWNLDSNGGPVGSSPFGRYSIAGSWTLAYLDIEVDPAAPFGDYTLNAQNIHAGEPVYFSDIGGTPGDPFVVHIVPEPATLTLLLAPLAMVLRRRQR